MNKIFFGLIVFLALFSFISLSIAMPPIIIQKQGDASVDVNYLQVDVNNANFLNGFSAVDLNKTLRPATKVIAAYNSLDKNQADVVCSGRNDHVCINNEIAKLPKNGGKILLLEGDFNLGGAITINKSNVFLEGMGGATHIYGDANWGGVLTNHMITIGLAGGKVQNVKIKDLNIASVDWQKYNSKYGIVFLPDTNYAWVENTFIAVSMGAIYTQGTNMVFINNLVISYGDEGIQTDDSNYVIIKDNLVFTDHPRSNYGGIRLQASNFISVLGNQIKNWGGPGVLFEGTKNSTITNNKLFSNMTKHASAPTWAGNEAEDAQAVINWVCFSISST